MNTREPHFDFRLNGISFGAEELKEVGYSLIKEGEPHEQSLGDFLLDWLNDEPTISVKTSGSTGNPKIIALKKEHMTNSALATGKFFELEPGDSALLCIPTDFIAGKMMLVRAMVLGLKLDYLEPSSRPLDFVSKSYNFCAMIPMQLGNSLAKIDQIKTLIVGGAPISNTLRSKLQKKRGHIFETYGMTETCTHIAVRRIKGILSKAVETTFGTLPSVTVSKDDRDCLVIDAPEIADQKITTNDVVNLVSETEFEWLGRYDNVINSGGLKLFPEQIEPKLTSVVQNRFFVAGLPNEQLGQLLIMIVEGVMNTDELLQKIKAMTTLERFEVPKRVVTIPKFVETDSGKINRKRTIEVLKSNTP